MMLLGTTNDIVHDDSVEAQEQLELSAELMECMGD